MPEYTSDPGHESEPRIQNRTSRPPGILPKNAQNWLIAGISVVMIAVIALSGGSSQKQQSPGASTTKQASVIDPNAARIAEYRNRIEEQARRLAAEQAALAQTKQAVAGEVGSVPAAAPGPASSYPPAPVREPVDDKVAQRNQIEAEKEKREYLSLFASNVALSHRRGTASQDSVAPLPQSAPQTYSHLLIPPAAPGVPAGANRGVAPDFPVSKPESERAPQAVTSDAEVGDQPSRRAEIDPALQQAGGKQYRLFEGTIIEAVLTNRLTGSLAGPVNCMVTTNVYSHDRQHLLIPQGSRMLGEVTRVSSFGQERLAVVFHRITMPDGFSASLDQFQGLNQIGETGLRDQVNRHYLRTFGVSIAIGAIAGLAQANTRSGFDTSAEDAYRQGFATSLSQSALRILDRFLNILPTFTVREGHRIKVYLAGDVLLPAYNRHSLPTDL